MLTIFLTAGYPNTERTIKALKILHEENVDLVELGVPFSDPLADGPVIQNSSFKALESGINIDKIFEIISRTKEELNTNGSLGSEVKGVNNLILFTYYNPVYNYGLDKLIEKCLNTGVKGLLIPDLPVDEAEELRAKLNEHGLTLTLLAAITSTDERLQKIAELSEPFIYLVSRIGITGSNKDINNLQENNDEAKQLALLKEKIAKLKNYAPDKAIGLGFGIDSPEKVKATFELDVDMAIIGTKAIRVLEADSSENLNEFRDFIKSLRPISV
ncbi:MAG: tryptophan synthase subunit alpha [Candidatus Caenarcaniphilales bacterium]|nr:tryptophan synthase subunit alpha [Candidatus Caenarcaniphilales bacterium]